MSEADFDKEAIAAEISKQASSSDNDDAAIAGAEAKMEALGFNPKADEIIPEDEPVPAEDLEDIEDDEPESEVKEDDEPTPEDDDEEEADKDEEEVAKDEEAQEGAEQEDEQKDEQKDEPQLSDAYYRAAIHSGMNEAEIKKFMGVDPDLALKTFGNLYESMNRTSQEFADLGRFKKEQAAKGADNAPENKSGFDKIDTTAMRTEFGDDVADQFDKQQEQLAALYDKQAAAAPVTSSSDRELQDERTKNAVEQVEVFFNSKDMAKYEQTYGITKKDDVEWTGLMPNARMNRVAVVDSAIELIDGAAVAGRVITVPEALERAHLMVTQPIRDKIIRDDIIGKVVKRSRSITLKPSGKVADSVDKSKGPKTASEVEDSAAARLAKVFG